MPSATNTKMLNVIENLKEVNILPKYESEKEEGINKSLMASLDQKFHGICPDGVRIDKDSSIWMLSNQTYCYDEWTELVKLLRIADQDVRHIISTNSYIEERLMKYYNEVKNMRLKLDFLAGELNELLKIDIEFTRIVSGFIAQCKESDVRNVLLRNLAKKSKSAEYSEYKMCPSCGLILKRFQAMPRKEKSRRKKHYGKYCSTCGAVEVPSGNSIISCRHCHGEIIVHEQCSSCDSFEIDNKFKKFDVELERNSHLSYNFPKKLNLMSDKNMKPWSERWFFYKKKYRKEYESSYCSDCEFASSCDVSTKIEIKKRNASIDSIFPHSDSENQLTGMRSYSCDYDVSSSVSSFDAAMEKFKRIPMVNFNEPVDVSFDEHYATPQELFSVKDVNIPETDSDPSFKTTVAEFSEEEVGRGRMDSLECTQSLDSSNLSKIIQFKPIIDKICDRLLHADEALGDIKFGNGKLEEGILIMENISHQNMKLSITLKDIVTKITNSLNETQKMKVFADESENSDDFEEALEDLTDTENYFDTQSSSTYHSCLERGVALPHQQLSDNPCLEKNFVEMSKNSLKKLITEESLQSADKAILPAQFICKNLKLNDNFSAYPVLFTENLSYPSFTSVEDRLKFIERETSLLEDNNEIINLFVDDLQAKLQTELDCVQAKCTRKNNTSETKIVGFDVSFYQFTGQIMERKIKEENALKKSEEDEICQKRKTFLEMKFEEVYKNEKQTAMELEIFEERLEIEGLIMKEKEDFFTCSNIAEAVEDENFQAIELSHKYTSEKLTKAMRNRKNDNLLISIEIEVEKDKKTKRWEYKDNLHKRKMDRGKIIPSITLYPVWASNRSALTYSSGGSPKLSEKMHSDCEFNNEKPYFIDIESDEFVEIKSPNFFSSSSEDEDEEWNKEKKYIMANAASYVPMPFAIYPITEITPSEMPFVVLSTVNKKKEFSRISQIELSRSPESGVVFVQTKAILSLSAISCPEDESLEEFFEAQSSVTSFNEKIGCGTLRNDLDKKSLVQFIPIHIERYSVLTITFTNETLLLVISDEISSVTKVKSIPDHIPELRTALSLIREIENDVVDVKLDNAIAILPQLESVLREHIQNKTKELREKSSVMSNTSLDMFMSALSFIVEDRQENGRELPQIESYERLGKMLNLLMELEKAVKEMNAADYEKMDFKRSGRIYHLVQDLSTRVEKIGSDVDVLAMEKTLELTSELDVAVRDYSSYLFNEDVRTPKLEKETISSCTITAETLDLIKKKIFEIVTFEALERDLRIEEDIERIRTLEKENFEVMCFLDTLLDKTLKRAGELEEIRAIALLFRGDIQKHFQKPEEKPLPKMSGIKIAQTPTLPSIQEVSSDCRSSSEEENVTQTLSDMITALDNLKTKAKQKTNKCREILQITADSTSHSVNYTDELDVKNIGLSEVRSKKERESSKIIQFSRIGANTFFITWSKPMQVDGESPIVGYEIWANGKVNQRVRNPNRLKAVLYSVHPTTLNGNHLIKLFAITEDGRRLSLADLQYPEEGDSDLLNIIASSTLYEPQN